MYDKPLTPAAIWAADMAKEIMRGMDLADGANDNQIRYDDAVRYLEAASRDALRRGDFQRAEAFIRAETAIRKSHQQFPERVYFRVSDTIIDSEFAANDGVVKLEMGKRGGGIEVKVPAGPGGK